MQRIFVRRSTNILTTTYESMIYLTRRKSCIEYTSFSSHQED